MQTIKDMFNNQKYVLFKDVLSPEICDLATNYMLIKKEAGLLEPPVSMGGNDSQCPKSYSIYGDPLFDTILARLAPQISSLVGINLVPAYTYARVYQNGEVLEWHKDRPSCEYSGTITLGKAANEPIWPIYVGKDDNDTTGKRLDVDIGEMMFYQGCEVPHWRNEYKGDWQCQVFVHYVNAEGPYAQDCALDGRKALGLLKTPENMRNSNVQQAQHKLEQEDHTSHGFAFNQQQDQVEKPVYGFQQQNQQQTKKELPYNFEFKVGQ